MRIKQLVPLLTKAFQLNQKVLLLGSPGIGKTDVIRQVAKSIDADLITSYVSVCEPIDFRGFPALTNNGSEAHFLPFGELNRIIHAKKKTIFFLDDLSQSSVGNQSAVMNLILGRHINGVDISPHVVFCAAGNRMKDMAGTVGFIEPLKSRFDTILELETHIDDWVQWAYQQENFPFEIIAFLRFRPELLCKFTPTREMTNSPSPRQYAALARWFQMGEIDFEIASGAIGQGAATEILAYIKTFKDLPDLDDILLNPDKAPLVEKKGAMFAVASGLARKCGDIKATAQMIVNAVKYLRRLGKEWEIMCVKDIFTQNPNAFRSDAGKKIIVEYYDLMLDIPI